MAFLGLLKLHPALTFGSVLVAGCPLSQLYPCADVIWSAPISYRYGLVACPATVRRRALSAYRNSPPGVAGYCARLTATQCQSRRGFDMAQDSHKHAGRTPCTLIDTNTVHSIRHALPLPRVSPRLTRLFAFYAQRYLRRSFHAVRLARAERLTQIGDRPLVVYCNHPSWWDPLCCLFLAYHLFPTRTHYAPMDAAALARYRFFRRLGFFGVAPGTLRGAATFLRYSRAIVTILERLWMNAEGQFTITARPVRFQPGIGHVARLFGAVFLFLWR